MSSISYQTAIKYLHLVCVQYQYHVVIECVHYSSMKCWRVANDFSHNYPHNVSRPVRM